MQSTYLTAAGQIVYKYLRIIMPKLTEAQIEKVIAHIQKYPEFYDQLFNSKYGEFTKNSNSSIFAVLDAESTEDTDVIVDVLVKTRDSLAKITKYNQQKTATSMPSEPPHH